MRNSRNISVATSRALATCVLIGVIGCTTSISLTDEGTRVRHVMRGELPASCRVIGDIPIGIPPDAAQPPTEEDMIILMRNKAGAGGATHVIVDTSSHENLPSGDRAYRGRGTSYRCAAESSGGEETDGADTEDDDDSLEGDDSPDDDGSPDEDTGGDGESGEDDALDDLF